MTVPCPHPRTGRVTTHPMGYTNGPHAATNVCDLPECIDEAKQWVRRVTGKQPHHVLDEEKP